MRSVYTVGQVNSYIKNMFTQDFALNRIYIKGEVSNCKYHSSGHIYFSLKDETGTIACVMFAGQRKGLAFRMENGQTVIAMGSVNVYERDGRYQLYAKEILLDGAGILYQKFEALKQSLKEMGMFAEEYKRPIPKYAGKIGIVTAPTGAAVRDMIQVTKRRNPFIQLVLYPALVQGEGAADSIVKGIQVLEQTDVDVIIIGRGGGSIEDLWAFNEERVARAVFDCCKPVISAVGHETDVTISDYVADLRAPTPSAAAELAAYEFDQVMAGLAGYRQLMKQLLKTKQASARERAERYRVQLSYLSPENKLRERRQYTADLEDKLRAAMKQKREGKRHNLELYIEKFKGLSPLLKLQQGYSYTTDKNGQALISISQAEAGDQILVEVADGTISASVTAKEKRKEQW